MRTSPPCKTYLNFQSPGRRLVAWKSKAVPFVSCAAPSKSMVGRQAHTSAVKVERKTVRIKCLSTSRLRDSNHSTKRFQLGPVHPTWQVCQNDTEAPWLSRPDFAPSPLGLVGHFQRKRPHAKVWSLHATVSVTRNNLAGETKCVLQGYRTFWKIYKSNLLRLSAQPSWCFWTIAVLQTGSGWNCYNCSLFLLHSCSFHLLQSINRAEAQLVSDFRAK